MGTNFHFAITQNARTTAFKLIAGRQNIRHFITQMMDSTIRIFLKKSAKRRVLTKRL